MTLVERGNDLESLSESESMLNMSYESQDLNMSVDVVSLPADNLDLQKQFDKLKEDYQQLKSRSDAQIRNLKMQLKLARKEIAALEADKDQNSDPEEVLSVNAIADNLKRQEKNRLSPHVILILMKVMARGISQESYYIWRNLLFTNIDQVHWGQRGTLGSNKLVYHSK